MCSLVRGQLRVSLNALGSFSGLEGFSRSGGLVSIKWNGPAKALEVVGRPSVLVPFLITCVTRNSYHMWQLLPSSLKPEKNSSNETLVPGVRNPTWARLNRKSEFIASDN